MEPKFNIDRPRISDDEINKHKDFERLVQEFKKSSIKQAQGDESWRKNKKIRYTAIIAGVTVVCTVTLISLLNQKETKHETLTTSESGSKIATTKKPFVNAPSPALAIPYSSYKVNNSTGGNITHASASKIHIPANSFVTKEGKDVKGEITIEYREFHDPADIVVSGIPMAYDSAGTKYNLESAGMFDIRGTQNGEPVFIKPQKTLQIELASTRNENRFNQYFLDTVAGNWQYLKKDKADPVHAAAVKMSEKQVSGEELVKKSPRLLALKNEIEVVIPKKVDSVKVVYSKKTQQLFKPAEPFKPATPTKGRQSFKLDGSYKEFPELSAFNNVLFEVGPENTNISKDLYELTWSDIKISQGPVKGKNYRLHLSYRNRTEQLIVYPVLTGTDLDKAQTAYEEHLATYETLKEKRQAAEKRLLDELQAKQTAYLAEQKKKQEQYDKEKAALFAKYNVEAQNELASSFNLMSNSVRASRLFSVSQFGIYNSDCPHRTINGRMVDPVFVVNGKPLIPDLVYLVDHTERVVTSMDAKNSFKISYVPENVYTICIFSKNKLFLCNKTSFGNTAAGNNSRFIAEPLESGNMVDFKKALEI